MIFIAPDITRAIGLNKLYKELKIVCFYQSDLIEHLKKEGVPVLCVEEIHSKTIPNAAAMLALPEVQNWIQQQEQKPCLLVFKPAAKIEALVRHLGWELKNPPSELNRLYEDKISFIDVLKELNLPMPKTIVKSLGEVHWSDIEDLGGKCILQLRRGHAGETSYIITNEKELSSLQKDLAETHRVKISEFLEGETITFNCSIDTDVHIGYVMHQITGVDALNTAKLGTCGVYVDTNEPVREDIEEGIQKLGNHMKQNGYQGVFGVDIIIQENAYYFIECNARFTATISFYSQLEKAENVQKATQVILRNTGEKPVKIQHDFSSGIYELQGGKAVKVENEIHLAGLKNENQFLLLVRPAGSTVSPGLEIGYMQALSPLVINGEPDKRVTSVQQKVRESAYIDPKNFQQDQYGYAKNILDVLMKPLENYAKLTPRALSRNRQTQILPEEPSFWILSEENGFFLIKKHDGTMGWVPKNRVLMGTKTASENNKISESEFFARWEGVQYLWGGISKQGIDCSGLVQQFFLHTRGTIMPKHSQDQRKQGINIRQNDLKDGDVIFLKRDNINHVAIFYNNRAWHACLREKKVISESLSKLLETYSLEECRRIEG